MTIVKELIKSVLYSKISKKLITSTPAFRLLVKDSLVVFLFHDVDDSPSEFSRDNGLCTPVEIFENQIKYITETFQVLTPGELLENEFNGPAAFVTFDDGVSSYFKTAVPIMQKYNCPSTIFLNFEPIHGEVFWSGLISYLAKKDLAFKEYAAEKQISLEGFDFIHFTQEIFVF